MRARLRTSLADRSAALDRSWRFQAARRMARIPTAAVAAAALLLIASATVLVRYEMEKRGPAARRAPIEAGALPIPALTPGATASVTAADLCAGRGPSKEDIAPAIRQAVLRDYGMEGLPDADYELDYLITPELGGSSDRRNLWPERYGARVWNARVKDELEGPAADTGLPRRGRSGDGAARHRGQLDRGLPEILSHRSSGDRRGPRRSGVSRSRRPAVPIMSRAWTDRAERGHPLPGQAARRRHPRLRRRRAVRAHRIHPQPARSIATAASPAPPRSIAGSRR